MRMPPLFPARPALCGLFLLALGAASLAGEGAAAAQEWRSAGTGAAVRAFYTQGGRPAGIEFACEAGGSIRTLVAGNGARFGGDRERTLVLSVDGVARVALVRAEPEPNGGGSRFVRRDPAAALGPFLDQLAKGRELEVSAPAGALRLPLRGSGKAIAALRKGCAP